MPPPEVGKAASATVHRVDDRAGETPDIASAAVSPVAQQRFGEYTGFRIRLRERRIPGLSEHFALLTAP